MRRYPIIRKFLARQGAKAPARTKGQTWTEKIGRMGENNRARLQRKRALVVAITATATEGDDSGRPRREKKLLSAYARAAMSA
jgi:hypothetical protein